MSIALEAKVDALQKEVARLMGVVASIDGENNALRDALKYFREDLTGRVAALETARKPGPKPKEVANG
jgi:hypothetical protein